MFALDWPSVFKRTASVNQPVTVLNGTSAPIAPASEQRVGLIITVQTGSSWSIDTKPIVGQAGGLQFPNNSAPFQMFDWTHGDIVKKQWFLFAPGPSPLNVTVMEIMQI